MVSPRYVPHDDAQYARIGANDSLTPVGLVGYLAVLAGVLAFLTEPVLVGAVAATLAVAAALVWTVLPRRSERSFARSESVGRASSAATDDAAESSRTAASAHR
ncbi:hypothetical protein [Haloarcula nitratireducens]|uniref:Uncharacterized protein n=1 Tax=Haloarcula nitratireducens TaxID=2487749 RepID=A0AAW4PF64_9EURY|nr:hypothetical protein [Halomicroarcula nitratireducens]MBX0295917.1 hypothetical protein [Halomicroarcula nitratireducens]